MSCNTCVRQAIPAMSGVGIPRTQSHAAWGGTSWRCPVCGKWTDQSNVCTDPECLGRVGDARVDEGALAIPWGASFNDTLGDVAGVVENGMKAVGLPYNSRRPWMITLSSAGGMWGSGRISVDVGAGFPPRPRPGVRLVDQDTVTNLVLADVGVWIPGEVDSQLDTYEVTLSIGDDDDQDVRLSEVIDRGRERLERSMGRGGTSTAQSLLTEFLLVHDDSLEIAACVPEGNIEIEPVHLRVERRPGEETWAIITLDLVYSPKQSSTST